MKFLFSLSLKNIIRYKKRTILTFLILSFGIAFYIWMDSFIDGLNEQSFDNVINFETSHFKIQSEKYDEDKPFSEDNFMNNYKEVVTALEGTDFIESHTTRIKFPAELDNSIDSTPCLVIGIDQEQDKKVFILPEFIEEGSLKPGCAMIGKKLAASMDVKVGDFIYITFREAKGMFNSIEMEVTGIVFSPDPGTNNSTVFINLSEAKEFLNTEGVTEIAIKTNNRDKYKKYKVALQKSIPDYKIQSWIDMSQNFLAISKMKKKFSFIFVYFIIIIALVGIINTMLMSVLEKKREIGTMKALGFTDGDILKMFIFEGAIIGVLGSIFGIILSIILNWYFVEHGIDMTTMMEGFGTDNMGYKIIGIAKSTWSIKPMINSIIICVIASVAASYYPAKQATKLQPVECLRTIQ
ncbi:ABC transporter permease [Candidatus Dependentiae bacterium]|nr:ABC transporter permease [Candidatus Dependentiae bacterium]